MIPEGVVVPPVELLTDKNQTVGGLVAFVKKAVILWFEPVVWFESVIVEVVLVEVTLYMVRLAEVMFIESNCQ